MRVLEDVSLSAIEFSVDGRGVFLDFLNLTNGEKIGQIECLHVVHVLYQSALDEDGLPVYVGEVAASKMRGESRHSLLKRLGYSYSDSPQVDSHADLIHVHVEGGEVCLDVCCLEYRLKMI